MVMSMYMYMYVHIHVHSSHTLSYRKLTRNEHFELRDLKETISGGNHSKHQSHQAGMVWIPPQEGLMATDLYYDFVQVSKSRQALIACAQVMS